MGVCQAETTIQHYYWKMGDEKWNYLNAQSQAKMGLLVQGQLVHNLCYTSMCTLSTPQKKTCIALTLDHMLDFSSRMQEGCGMGGICGEAGLDKDFTAQSGFCWQVAVMLATCLVGAWVMKQEQEMVTDSSVVWHVQVTVLEVASARSSCKGQNGTSWFRDDALIAGSQKDKRYIRTSNMADLTAGSCGCHTARILLNEQNRGSMKGTTMKCNYICDNSMDFDVEAFYLLLRLVHLKISVHSKACCWVEELHYHKAFKIVQCMAILPICHQTACVLPFLVLWNPVA
ncbi:hypothetical protein BKA83DRAFT_4128030 [Pisolithus microcarpus]|nr:hypothetical protein BKA83DRAFT_4128030 [Pisolithus microcarpus]